METLEIQNHPEFVPVPETKEGTPESVQEFIDRFRHGAMPKET